MSEGTTKVLLSKTLADQSAAYLAMWTALEGFDPNADRWAEPVSFGSREERIQSANGAIARFNERHQDAVDQDMKQDIEAFRGCLAKLSGGSVYDTELDRFCWHLRDKGSALADQSVTLARRAT